ncbi:MAG: tRNA (adenosine(37)-N6)-dimethylallyltransferase MiaA [Pseudomonadota bacterium]
MTKLVLERPIICIAGPTASGKTDYAVQIAKKVDGEVVNADALQVYADISILSARPSNAEMDDIPHHMFGHVPGGTFYSTGDWLRDALKVFEDIDQRGKIAVLVGGTGLYFQALLNGLADVPEVEASIIEDIEPLSVNDLREEAESVDPVAAARILGDDPQRLGRIVGVFRSTGRPLSEWQADTQPSILAPDIKRAVLLPERDTLYQRINRRFDMMMDVGALEEAQGVHKKNHPKRAPMLKAIGLSHLLSHLDGECDLETAIETAKRDSRRLAKRQMTWFRNRCADWTVLFDQTQKDDFLAEL